MFLVQINPEAKTNLTCLLFSREENASVFLMIEPDTCSIYHYIISKAKFFL